MPSIRSSATRCPAGSSARLARQKQRASRETLAFLAEACEGNLLAARQEIEKLALLLPDGELDAAAVEAAVADVARFDVFELSEAWLAGDASRAVRILRALQAEGDAPTLPIWQLSEDVHAIATVAAMVRSGTPVVGGRAQRARVGQASGRAGARGARVAPSAIASLLVALARLDALAKGIGTGNRVGRARDARAGACGRTVR